MGIVNHIMIRHIIVKLQKNERQGKNFVSIQNKKVDFLGRNNNDTNSKKII